MYEEKHRYIYEGPVYEFDRCILDSWKAETIASSEQKARSNISYRYKKLNNRIPGTKVKLPGKIKMVS